MPPGFGPDDPDANEQAEYERAPVEIRSGEVYEGESDEVAPRLCIVLEPQSPGRGVLLGGETAIRLVFRKGTPMELASQLRAGLDRHVEAITYQKFIT